MTAKTRLSTRPILIMSLCWIFPELKTSAFGGVAMGSINAHDAARVSGRTKCLTGIFMSMATVAKIGTNNAVLAVLLDSSVRNIMNRTTAPTRRMTGQSVAMVWISPARYKLAPVMPRILLSVSPPPKSSKIPQSVARSISFQLTRRQAERVSTALTAMMVSKDFEMPKKTAR